MAVYAARAANTLTTAAKLAKQVVAQQKSHSVPTGLFPSYGYTPASHFATVPVSAFSLREAVQADHRAVRRTRVDSRLSRPPTRSSMGGTSWCDEPRASVRGRVGSRLFSAPSLR